jgi:DtxR family Mn-dependent transcriptional regulator
MKMAENANHTKSVLFDEILEILYVRRESGKTISAEAFLRIEHYGQKFTSEIIDEAVSAGLIKKVNNTLNLTNKGLSRATQLTRCHRLAERLLTDILNVQDNLVESSACHFEHILSEEVADSICTLLGHPRTCPHGKPIPQGLCCRRAQKQIAPIVRPLSRFISGERGMVAYISSPYHDRLTRLESMGLSPGQEIIVRQVHPSFIVSCGETELALEKSVADEIYLRVSGNNVK